MLRKVTFEYKKENVPPSTVTESVDYIEFPKTMVMKGAKVEIKNIGLNKYKIRIRYKKDKISLNK